MIGSDVGVLEDRRHFVLAGRDLVVPRLDRNANLVELALDVHHEREDAIRDGAEVLILELLALGRLGAEERAAGVDEVRPIEEELTIDQEVFLLRTAGRDDALGLGTEELQDADGLLGEGLHRAQQRCLLVEGFTCPADEGRRDDERRAVLHHQQPGRAGRVPRRVAAGLEGGPHAARGKTRRVGLAFDQLLAAELGDGAAVGRRRQERVVLLGGDAGHRLEPVRVVRGAMLDRPVLQRRGNDVGDGRVDGLSLRDRAAQRAVDILGQTGALRLVVEGQRAKLVTRLGTRGGRGLDAKIPGADVADRVDS